MEDIQNIGLSVSNITIDFSKVNIKQTYSINKTGKWYNIAISGTGQYQVGIQNSINGSFYTSSDYGVSWTLPNIRFIGYFTGVALSKTGQYQTVLLSYNGIYISKDYGNTWQYIHIFVYNNLEDQIILDFSKNWSSVAMSGNGKYQTIISYNDTNTGGYIFRSDNYGSSWVDITSTLKQNGFFACISISYNGKIQLIVISPYSNDTGVYPSSYIISYDYGITWSSPVILGGNLVGCVINSSPDESIDGKIQYAIDTGDKGIHRSIDYGQTWSIQNILELNNFETYNTYTPVKCNISGTGEFQYITLKNNAVHIIIYSKNYGYSWNVLNTSSIDNISPLSAISSNGQYLVFSNGNSIYELYLNLLIQ
jgi:hypothetical protein